MSVKTTNIAHTKHTVMSEIMELHTLLTVVTLNKYPALRFWKSTSLTSMINLEPEMKIRETTTIKREELQVANMALARSKKMVHQPK